MRGDRRAFTVVELLIATLLLAVLLAGLFSFTRSTLLFTGLTQAVSTSIEDIADAEGYLADALRNAKAVFGSLVLATPDYGDLACDISSGGRCVAVLSPVLGGAGGGFAIEDFDLQVFAVIDDADLYSDIGLVSSRRGEAKLTLVEFRVEGVCSGCSSASEYELPDKVAVTLPTGFIVGDLSPVAPGDGGLPGDEVAVFSVPPELGETSLQITLVVRADARAAQPFVVRQTPVALQVAVRGLVPEAEGGE